MKKLKKDDQVKVMVGKDAGKTGKVLRILSKEDKVLVEGVNVYKRHVRHMANQEGRILDISKPVQISNVVLICPSCKATTRVGFKVEGDKKARICKKCQQLI